jgi:serine phosphatase RsbU (regulator of sigma subunit)
MAARRWSQGGGLVVPFAILGVIVLLDVGFAPDLALGAVYPIAAVAAAEITTVDRTVVVGAVAVLLAAVSGVWNEDLLGLDWAIRSLLSVALAALAVTTAGVRAQREHELRHMSAIAETAQRAMLRVVPGRVGPVRFGCRYVSATRAALMGGDLYEVAETRYGVRVIIGDVKGKGLGGVQMAATVLAAFRRSAVSQPALAAVARELDSVVEAVAGEEDFVTAVLAEFCDNSAVRVANCGHHAPLLVTDTGAAELLETGEAQLPLGLGAAPRAVQTWIPDGARVLFYTDGLVEARDADGEFFSLLDSAPVLGKGTLGQALDELVTRVTVHAAGDFDDDMGLVLAEYRLRHPPR